jgi:hypothetical protein
MQTVIVPPMLAAYAPPAAATTNAIAPTASGAKWRPESSRLIAPPPWVRADAPGPFWLSFTGYTTLRGKDIHAGEPFV